jgi:hypothetical protein
MEKLYEDKTFSDFTFYVDNKEIKVHKCIIALKSEYFKTLFLSDFTKTSYIKDVSYNTFEKVIRFMYLSCDTPPRKIKFENDFLEFVDIAEKYFIEELKMVCISKFRKIATIDFFIENLLYLKNYEFMKGTITDYVIKYWSELVGNDTFFDIIGSDKLLLKTILQNSTLSKSYKISETDKETIKKILHDKQQNATPELTHRINEIFREPTLFDNPKNIEIVFKELKISTPKFLKKYL